MLSDSSLPNLETKCNTKLNQLKNWCNTNKLQKNSKKSNVLFIPSKLNSPPLNLKIYYDNSIIVCQESCKYLGMHLESKLLLKNHVKQIEVEVAKGVGILSKLRFLFPKSTLLLLCYALVHPRLLYALPLWGCTYQKYTQKLQLLQNKVIRVICDSNRFSSVTPPYFELGILKINEPFKFEIGKLMHQHSHNLLPPGISTLFTNLSTIHSRQTRSQTQKSLYLPKFSTQRCQRSVKFQGTKIWNSFYPEFKILSFRKFKSEFKNQLVATYPVVN